MRRKNITIKTIAQELGVSISTVSRALKNNPRIGTETRLKVKQLAEKFNYIPDPTALNLQRRRTNLLGLVVPTLEEEFFSHIVSGVERIAAKNGFHLIINQSRDSMQLEKEIIRSYIASKVDGIMVSVAANTSDYSHFVRVQSHDIPLVFYDRIPRNFPSNKVRSEVLNGAVKAINFLYGQGKRKIALLNGPSNLQVSDDRLNGYLEAVKNLGLRTSPRYIKTTDLSRHDAGLKMAEFIQMGEDRPDAVICFNDYVALYAIRACLEYAVVPNHDISFVSFANIGVTEFIENKPMASVEQYPVKIGTETARLLLEDIHSENSTNYRETVVEAQLVIHTTDFSINLPDGIGI